MAKKTLSKEDCGPGCGCSSIEPKDIKLFSCAGASRNGLVSYLTARRLTQRGFGSLSCLAGVSAGIEGMISSAKNADLTVTLDGCAQKCASKTLLKAGIDSMVIVYSQSGLKVSGENPSDKEVEDYTDYVVSKLLKK
jgi:uncharacterized metal-binding protein